MWGSLGWTKTTDGLNWKMSDRLGWGRIAAMLIYGLWMSHSPARRTRRKKGRRGLRPWPLRCLSQTFSKKRECLDCLVLAYLFPLGWPRIYNVYCSQFEGCQDSLLLDEILFAFIGRDIKGKTVAKDYLLSCLIRSGLSDKSNWELSS